MISLHAIVFFCAVHLAVGVADHLEVTMPMKELLVLDRADDGRWTVTQKPDRARGTFRIKGNTLKHTGNKGERAFDMNKLIGVDDETDWEATEKLRWGDHSIVVKRGKGNTAEIHLTFGGDDRAAGRTLVFKVAW